MNFIVFDLEATCWDQHSRAENETIEIGALLIRDNIVVEEFQRFIQPIRYPILSDFCKELTSITQADVDEAKHFYDVIHEFKEWIAFQGDDYLLCSWGFYDRKQLESDCKLHHLDIDWLTQHISVKHQYRDVRQLRRAIGMKKALEMEGFSLEGTHHRGIDDARNIAKIFQKYYNEWKY